MADNIGVIWNKFFKHRTRTLWDRFPGYYRALVIETNDPLNVYRVRFKCPDMHDWDLKDEDCPWAVPSFDLGTKRHGRWSHPCIGDWVWITFEKQHPYGPIWVGFADPTRRKFYSYPSIFSVTPLSLAEDGEPDDKPEDYDEDYLPKDGRPMSHGWQDRYGNLDIHSSVGFFPNEHKEPPPPADHDAIQGQEFEAKSDSPEVNNPDKKYMARVTKYGNMIILGDQGYKWKSGEGDVGEFEGDFDKDEKFETKRWLHLQKLLNEGQPDSSKEFGDQRRAEIKTRYGHRIECRDVGWAQEKPVASKTRQDEYGEPKTIGSGEHDFRWIKLRTKAGMLIQLYDKGSHPNDDKFVKRSLLDEAGHKSEREDKHWKDKDARWIRILTRYGLKIVLDDRGSHNKKADKKESPRANGILIKGRRSPGVKADNAKGNPRGFYWEFNENNEANHTMWGTPMGLTMEMNDRYQYVMLSASMGKGWSPKWRGVKENEFIRKPTMMKDPERKSHHLKIDHDNEYIRLKTRAKNGPKPKRPANPSQAGDLNQGVEMRDGAKGDGPWTEIVDSEHRGMWWSKRYKVGVWRGKEGNNMYEWFHDTRKEIVLYNGDGKIKIYSRGDIEIKSDSNIHFDAANNITMKAGNSINMQCVAEYGVFSEGHIRNLSVAGIDTISGGPINNQAGGIFGVMATTAEFGTRINAKVVDAFFPLCFPGPGAGIQRGSPGTPIPPQPASPLLKPQVPQVEPTDRAAVYNEPFKECPKKEVEHKLES